MEQTIFTQLTLVIVIAAIISLIMRLLRQPLIMGYILTGIVVGPSVLGIIEAQATFHSFSQIGITLLLFIVGLGLNPTVIKNLGRPVLLTAAAVLGSLGIAGVVVSQLLGLNLTETLIIAVALSFSSTIIILKVISDKRELSRLYAQITLGVIVVEDIVATLALLVVAAIGLSGSFGVSDLTWLIVKGITAITTLYLVGIIVMPRMSKFFAHSQELLFLFAIAWGMGVASVFELAGFSLEVGALLAGISLAALPYAAEMAARLKPLRDFFILLFFVTLGETFAFNDLSSSLVPALILSSIILIGKPILVMASLGALGYTRLTSFKAGIHLSQISEFSMILILFAGSVGLASAQTIAIITLVAIITIGVSTYLMKYDEQLFKLLRPSLKIFERKNVKERRQKSALYPIILFGYHKGGHEFLQTFRDLGQRYLVVDYDPEIIDHLEQQGVRHAYGDATDNEFLMDINAEKAELVVSTITEIDVNRSLLTYLRQHNPDAAFICHAETYDEAAELYRHGASYVMLPHFLGSERISSFIKRHGFNHAAFDDYREKHIITIGRKALEN
ncbi:cation:proton antiporter [Pedobacter sp.]|nr:cation:proton antiporter [Candidatus Saccharibacteria bacterium]